MTKSICTTMIFIFFPLLTACSETTNPLGKLQPQDQQKSMDILLSEGQLHYDRGQYEKALTKVRIAYERDKNDEKAAVLLGFIYLAKGGMEPFTLAAKLSKQNKNSDPGSSQTKQNPLSGLESALGLSAKEYNLLTLPDNRLVLANGEVIEGAPQSGLFVDYPVLLPQTATDARKAASAVLSNVTLAIATICPFVKDEVKIFSDSGEMRYDEKNCPPSSNNLYLPAKAHFLWALAHLTEAIAFNAVVLYNPSGEGANLIRRTEALKGAASGNVAEYVKGVTDLATIVNIVLPVDPAKASDSMLTAMFNDLEIASKSFDLLPGMPASLSKSLKESITKLNEEKSKLGAANSTPIAGPALDAKVLKDSLTEKMVENLKEQIENKSAAGELSPSEVQNVCQAYQTIATETIDLCKSAF